MTTKITVSVQVDVSLAISDSHLDTIADELGVPKESLTQSDIANHVINECEYEFNSDVATIETEIVDIDQMTMACAGSL